jgi:hypothetical protein
MRQSLLARLTLICIAATAAAMLVGASPSPTVIVRLAAPKAERLLLGRHFHRHRTLQRLPAPVGATPAVVRYVTAHVQRAAHGRLDDNDAAIQPDTPAPWLTTCDPGVPVLEPIAVVASVRPACPRELESERRSPRGPPQSVF